MVVKNEIGDFVREEMPIPDKRDIAQKVFPSIPDCSISDLVGEEVIVKDMLPYSEAKTDKFDIVVRAETEGVLHNEEVSFPVSDERLIDKLYHMSEFPQKVMILVNDDGDYDILKSQ